MMALFVKNSAFYKRYTVEQLGTMLSINLIFARRQGLMQVTAPTGFNGFNAAVGGKADIPFSEFGPPLTQRRHRPLQSRI